jgi:hypothetical protein
VINSFLVTLTNTETPPVNPNSTGGNVLWPDNVLVKTYTGPAELARTVLFDNESDDLKRFLTAIQLLWVVENSVLAPLITADDPRISYTKEQLLGQFTMAVYTPQQISRILGSFDDIPALQFLQGDLLVTYRSALSRMDKLAAIISYFGVR